MREKDLNRRKNLEQNYEHIWIPLVITTAKSFINFYPMSG